MAAPTQLSPEQIAFYREHGYLRIENVYEPDLLQQMRDDLEWMMQQWANKSPGWSGPWRRQYMDEETEAKSKLIAMHDLYFYAESWLRAATHDKLCNAMADLLDGQVELHHSTLHVKPPETGHPFPMHQDWAFYKHTDNRYIDAIVHLDDTYHENGELRFLAGSNKWGALEHVTQDPETGEACTPHLPFEQYKLEDTVAQPAKAGDVVIFNIHTIHGSYINQTDAHRRLVRIGYRHPDNAQIAGQSHGRPGFMVRGNRPKHDGQQLFSIAGPAQPEANAIA